VRRDIAIRLLTRTTRSVKQIALAAAFRNEKSFHARLPAMDRRIAGRVPA
jgi:transcriptional regulator GlxA family with amidase domain